MSEPRSEYLSLPLSKEGFPVEEPSTIHYSVESSSSYSDAVDSEQSCIRHIPSSHHNYSGHYPFISKPVYPITRKGQATDGDVGTNVTHAGSSLIASEFRNSSCWPKSSVHHDDKKSCIGFSEYGSSTSFADHGSSSQRLQLRWNSANNLDFGWHHGSPDEAAKTDWSGPIWPSSSCEDLKCAICQKWMFQKSPWSSHSMVRSGDMPVAGVLSCSHVYHAECLEQTTPKSHKHDPPCPMCAGGFKRPSVSNSKESLPVDELQLISTASNEFSMVKITADDGSSFGNQTSVQSKYIAHGAGRKQGMHMPLENSKSFLRKNRLRKHFAFKGKSVKELPAVELGLKGAGYPIQLYPDHFPIGCSRRGQHLRNDRGTPFVKYHG